MRLNVLPQFKQTLGWFALALVFFILALVITLPAAQVASWLKLPLVNVQGMLWQGAAQLRAPGLRLEQLRWRLGLGTPFTQPVLMRIEAEDGSLRARGRLGLAWNGGMTAYDLFAEMRLNHPLLAQRVPVPLDGMAKLGSSELHWQAGAQGGILRAEDLRLTLEDVRIALDPASPMLLGAFVAAGEVKDGRLDLALSDRSGMLTLQGRLSGDRAQGLTLDARAEVKPEAPPALRDVLALLPAHPQGGVLLQTRLPAPWLATP